MIAIDLDGTLLSPEGKISERTQQAVRALLDMGWLVCFATGRNFTESRTVLETIAHYDCAVFAGGATVIDTREGVTLHRTLIDPALARNLCREIESASLAALALQDTPSAGVDYLVSEGIEYSPAVRAWMKATMAKVHTVGPLADYAHPHTIRVGTVAMSDETASLMARLQARFGEQIVCHTLPLSAGGLEVLEIFDPAVNKWQGILHVAQRHGISPEQIVAVGDDVNDLPMIRSAGLGVAMGNAREAVKSVARRVIGSNAEEGLAEFLEELGLASNRNLMCG
jgi:Cof subfamily protein (haloacid dehalogenase superfamily)